QMRRTAGVRDIAGGDDIAVAVEMRVRARQTETADIHALTAGEIAVVEIRRTEFIGCRNVGQIAGLSRGSAIVEDLDGVRRTVADTFALQGRFGHRRIV